MYKLKYYLAAFITFLLFYLIETQDRYCFPLCKGSFDCQDNSYRGCKSDRCRSGTGFWRGGNQPFHCVKAGYNYYSGDVKWQPSGFSPDIPSTYHSQYNPNVNVGATELDVQPDFQATCTKNSNTYTYYYLTAPDTLTVTHQDIADEINFWQIKLIYQVITFDNWNRDNDRIFTKFITDPAQINRANPINWNTARKMCYDNNGWQRTIVVIQDYTYPNKTNLAWEITTSRTDGRKWGVLNIIVSLRLCHPYCSSCFNDNKDRCTACNHDFEETKLSFQTCQKWCLVGYGDNTTEPAVCIKCQNPNCRYCLDEVNNCLGCNNTYFLLTQDDGSTICVFNCPSTHYKNSTANSTCFPCDLTCLTCQVLATNCTSCHNNTYLYQGQCLTECPSEFYENDTSNRCHACNRFCYQCDIDPTNCSVCETTVPDIAYLKFNNTCVADCGDGYYPEDYDGLAPNVCLDCDDKCQTCAQSPTNCFKCNTGFYFLNNTCNTNCPYPQYFTDDNTWRCRDCETFCVNMTMSLKWDSSLKNSIICDMTFTEDLSWEPNDIAAFINVTSNDSMIDLSSFDFFYEVVSPKIMRLRISPKGYAFIYNATFKFKTISYDPPNHHFATNQYRFRETTYDVEDSMVWFLIKVPSLTEDQKTIMDSFSNISNRVLAFTTSPYVQEIKKTGLFAMIMGGAQATSTAVLVNTIPAQNFYEGVRFWASFIFFDVPPWEEDSVKSKFMVVPNIDNLIQNARLLPQDIQPQQKRIRSLFDKSTINWRFQRTGHTSFFVFDTYMNVMMIVVCWIMVAIARYFIKHKVHQTKLLSYFYSLTHRFHEIAIFYISLTTLLEWLYFEPSSMERWLSMGLCIIFNFYFLAYELYIYYDMINYPKAHIGTKLYDYYVIRYGSLLKHMRFFQFNPQEEWSIKHWFRPYNYHIMSYYKKFLMMIALPIFYNTKNAQVSILAIIQLMEIIRFLIIWPFKTKFRNFFRLFLELCLFLFFVSIMVQAGQLLDITSGQQDLIAKAAEIYYKAGWLGFAMAFIFNACHIGLWAYDCSLGFKFTNRQLMDESRKFFYMEKLKEYEQQNTDVPLGLVNKWVKLGNLNNRNYDVLPDINLMIESFRITKTFSGFEIDMKKLFEAFTNIDFNFQKENNISVGKKIYKRIVLTRNISPNFYSMIENLFSQYNKDMIYQYITIKTFQKVIQSELEPGQKVKFDPLKMEQKIQLETSAGQKQTIKPHVLLPGLPLSYQETKKFV